ncbi:MAG: DUF1643 domain-containing protein [Bacteroidota bacterium]
MKNWLHIKSNDNQVRFLLGVEGKNPMVLMVAYPNMTTPTLWDYQIKTIIKLSKSLGYDGWMIISIYPQRVKELKYLHAKRHSLMSNRNHALIKKTIQQYNIKEIYAGWGSAIENSKFLIQELAQMNNTYFNDIKWLAYQNDSAKNHPRSIVNVPFSFKIKPFDMTAYLEKYLPPTIATQVFAQGRPVRKANESQPISMAR